MTAPNAVSPFQFDLAERVNGDRYLTPVYFNLQLLVRFLHDSRFRCTFASDGYGSIDGDDFDITFGINSRRAVVAWLGDIEKLPQNEQYAWLAENIAPQNDSDSEWREAQIHATFTDEPAAIRCLNALSNLNTAFHRRYSVHLYKPRSIEERIDEAQRFTAIVLNSEAEFKRFVSDFNEIINENTDNANLRTLLDTNAVVYHQNAKGNKLLQAVFENVLLDSNNLIAPFYYLYDLRIWASHSGTNDKLDAVALALQVGATQYFDLFSKLVAMMTKSALDLEALVV